MKRENLAQGKSKLFYNERIREKIGKLVFDSNHVMTNYYNYVGFYNMPYKLIYMGCDHNLPTN